MSVKYLYDSETVKSIEDTLLIQYSRSHG